MQALVDRLKDEVVSLSKKKDEENLQRQRRRSSAETIMVVEQQKRLNDLQHRLMESEGIIQWKSEQVIVVFFVLIISLFLFVNKYIIVFKVTIISSLNYI